MFKILFMGEILNQMITPDTLDIRNYVFRIVDGFFTLIYMLGVYFIFKDKKQHS